MHRDQVAFIESTSEGVLAGYGGDERVVGLVRGWLAGAHHAPSLGGHRLFALRLIDPAIPGGWGFCLQGVSTGVSVSISREDPGDSVLL